MSRIHTKHCSLCLLKTKVKDKREKHCDNCRRRTRYEQGKLMDFVINQVLRSIA